LQNIRATRALCGTARQRGVARPLTHRQRWGRCEREVERL